MHRDCIITDKPTAIYKHIAKATQANTQTKALSKSLQSRPNRKIVFKKFPTLQKKIKNATHSRHDNDTETQY
ncbi:MAG: hypothetical protein CVT96_06560 [Bacteroidetes bacterium HGW-Bacteroidetes-13]|nr:MAG: hypothetical protein CVT96_06560 [Bacteroidetes bacterium HGW-Bacteroidetes-13]